MDANEGGGSDGKCDDSSHRDIRGSRPLGDRPGGKGASQQRLRDVIDRVFEHHKY